MRNVYREFLKLIPAKPLLVGDVVSVDDGLVTIRLPGGSELKARGTASPGDRVFFRDGVIEGQAPTLPYVEFDL